MKLRTLSLINALAVATSLGSINFYFRQSLPDLLLTFFLSLAISFLVFYYLIERYVYSKIKLVYKLIHRLKLGKDLKDALGEFSSIDPMNDMEHDVRVWAKDKKIEIEGLKRQEQFRREFLSNLSHEFKTPLFALQGYVEALQEGGISASQEHRFLTKAARNLDRLNLLINDLDEISKLESGELPIHYTNFDIAQLINEVLESFENKAKKQRIQLLFKSKYQHFEVNADRGKIRQVFSNLIDNSLKYGKEGGTTALKLFELHDQILVEVTDDGSGIEEKSLPRVFERFYRIEQSRSREIAGSGLGLAIVKHIIEAHQQTIHVRSTPSVGSTFSFTLQKST